MRKKLLSYPSTTILFLLFFWLPQVTWGQPINNLEQETGQLTEKEIEEAIEKELRTGVEKKSASEEEKEPSQKPNQSVIDRSSLPNILVAVDMTGHKDLNKSGDQSNTQAITRDTASVREVEFGFFTAIDHWGNGSILFAAHNEGGAYNIELHEVFFELNRLPWNLYLKLGKFFYDIGRINGIHRHDWSFTQAPRVHELFFDKEAVDDFGGELSYLMPWNFFQEIKVGVFGGRKFGHSHDDGMNKPVPLYTARLKNFVPLIGNLGMQWGFSWLRYNVDGNKNNYWNTLGSDLTFKWYQGKGKSFEWTSEFWYRKENFAQGDPNKKMGFYSFMEYQPFFMLKIGARFDYFVLVNEFDAVAGKNKDKTDFGQSIWLTVKPSEFSYFRLTLERQDYYAKKNNYLLLLQADYILGFHPAHKY